jgi:hypothetical protein
VTALGVAAAVDAVRGEERSVPAPAQARAGASEALSPPDELRAAGVRGLLVYVDAGCLLRAVRLPGLGPVAVPERSVRIRGMGSPEPNCAGIDEFSLVQRAFVDRGEVVRLDPCRRMVCRRVLLSRRDLARASPYHVAPGEPMFAREIVSLSGGRLAVATRGTYESFVGVFRGRRFQFRLLAGFGSLAGLRSSPSGRYLVVEEEGQPYAFRIGSRATDISLPPGITTEHSIVFSPDERWMAVATRASVWILRTGAPRGRLIRIPLVVRELAWLPR